jgi:lipopolysaccharide export system permease protein
MTRILDRLVVGTFLKLFAIVVLLAAPPLFVIGDIAENLDNYIDRGLTGAEVAQAYLYMLPLFIQWSFPIAALLATVFTVHSMTYHSEIVAAKAGGISFYRLIAPLFVVGTLLTVVALGLSEVVPRTNRVASQILQADAPGRSWRRMTEVVLERPPTPGRAGMHVMAGQAGWNTEEGWTLTSGYLRVLRPDSTERALEFERLRLPEIDEKPEELLEVPPEPDEMTYAEIDRLAEIIERTGGNAKELLVKREQKISIPVATLVIILFGAPLATSSKRGGAAYGIGVALATVIVYMALLRVSGALGEAGALEPLVAAWLPNGFFLGAAMVALVRVRT